MCIICRPILHAHCATSSCTMPSIVPPQCCPILCHYCPQVLSPSCYPSVDLIPAPKFNPIVTLMLPSSLLPILPSSLAPNATPIPAPYCHPTHPHPYLQVLLSLSPSVAPSLPPSAALILPPLCTLIAGSLSIPLPPFPSLICLTNHLSCCLD